MLEIPIGNLTLAYSWNSLCLVVKCPEQRFKFTEKKGKRQINTYICSFALKCPLTNSFPLSENRNCQLGEEVISYVPAVLIEVKRTKYD